MIAWVVLDVAVVVFSLGAACWAHWLIPWLETRASNTVDRWRDNDRRDRKPDYDRIRQLEYEVWPELRPCRRHPLLPAVRGWDGKTWDYCEVHRDWGHAGEPCNGAGRSM